MKRTTRSAFLVTVIFAMMFTTAADAADLWEAIDWGIQPTSTPGVTAVDSKIYNARFTGQWNDEDNNGQFGAQEVLAEPVRLYDRKGNLVLETSEAVRTREDLQQWAIDNADIIWETIFGKYPSFGMGVSGDILMNQAAFSEVVLDKVSPQKRQAEAGELVDEFKAAVEYLSLEINGEKGDALSALLGYSHDYNNGINIGFLLPYRYTQMSDEINTNTHYAGLFLFAKKPVKTWEEQDLSWTIGADLFGSAFLAQSDAISDMGTLKYGGGLYTSITKYWSSVGLSLGADYKLSDVSVWDSVIDNEDEFVKLAVDWVNGLDPVNAFSYGFNIGVPLLDEDAAVNLETVRSHFISDDIDSDRDTQTVLGLTFSYYPTDTFEITLGGRATFELEDVEIYGITLGSIYRY